MSASSRSAQDHFKGSSERERLRRLETFSTKEQTVVIVNFQRVWRVSSLRSTKSRGLAMAPLTALRRIGWHDLLDVPKRTRERNSPGQHVENRFMKFWVVTFKVSSWPMLVLSTVRCGSLGIDGQKESKISH